MHHTSWAREGRSSCCRRRINNFAKRGRYPSMASIRSVFIRGSLALNAVLVLYLALPWLSSTPVYRQHSSYSHVPAREDEGEPRLLRQQDTYENWPENSNGNPALKEPQQPQAAAEAEGQVILEAPILELEVKNAPPAAAVTSGQRKVLGGEALPQAQPQEEIVEPPREVQERAGVTEQVHLEVLATDPPDPPLNSVERKVFPDLRECSNKPLRPFYYQRGDYWILENYIPAALSFRCDESITYTTHGDYTFLDNLDPLTSRWQGPVSIAVYSPGTDFNATIATILHLRDCYAEGIKKYVSFHIFFHVGHTPKKIPSTEELLRQKTDCNRDPPKWTNVTTYRMQKKLLYPVNVGRNTARLASQTYFVFPSDVELYPSVNFIPEFFKMIKRPDVSNTSDPRVFVFPIFEVKESVSPPETKKELVKMLKSGDAIPFHKHVCAKCHSIPKSKEWMNATINPGLSVFYIGKRTKPFEHWEPIYIGTNKEPLYDERLSWEGKRDKMTQMYILCLRDYEMHILDNAFLVHRPGIKRFHKDPARDKIVAKQNLNIKSKLVPEYRSIFGYRKNCTV